MKFFASQGRSMLTTFLIIYMFISGSLVETKLIQKYYLGRNRTIALDKTSPDMDDPEINIVNYGLPRGNGGVSENSNLKRNLIENLIETLDQDQILSNHIEEFYDV